MSRRELPFVIRWARAVASQHEDNGWEHIGDLGRDALAKAAEAQRTRTNARQLRLSPNMLGLSLAKRAIVEARCRHLISVRFAQRLIDLSKCWEA